MCEVGVVLDFGFFVMSGLVDCLVDVGFIECCVDVKDGCVWQFWIMFVGCDVLVEICIGLVELNVWLIEGFIDVEIDVVVCWLVSL